MKQAGISSDAVKAKTGKGWEEWFAILDAAGAQSLPHKQIADLLHTVHSVPGWWTQMVTVGYEQARGLREPNQQGSGYTANVSRTMDLPAAAIYDAWTNTRRRKRWLDLELKVTTASAPRSVRMAAAGGTRVLVYLYSKPNGKTTVQLQHEKLRDAKAVQEWKEFWSGAFERLKSILT